jgi:hypothetical protein
MYDLRRALGALGILALCPLAAHSAGSKPPIDPCASELLASNAELPKLPGVPGCPGAPDAPPRAEVPDLSPPAFSRTRKIHQTFVIDRPGTYDFGGELLEWSGPGSCKPQRNPIAGIDVRSSNVVIRNLGLHGAPGGIVVRGVNVRFENVTAWSCGQALTVLDEAGRIFVKDSFFYGHPQFTDGLLNFGTGDFSVENTLFSDSEVCLQFGGGQDANISSSNFVGCKTAILGNTLNNRRFSTMETSQNESWYGEVFFHLIGHVRGTSNSDLVYDGLKKKLEKDAHLIEAK